MNNFEFKSIINLEKPFGKKLVTIVYYAVAILIVLNMGGSFISGIASVATGHIVNGLGEIFFCLPLAAVYFLLLRLGCEVINAILEHCNKE